MGDINMNDEIKIIGIVEIKHGRYNEIYNNHIVAGGKETLFRSLTFNRIQCAMRGGNSVAYTNYVRWTDTQNTAISRVMNLKYGTDVSTPTLYEMTDIVSEITPKLPIANQRAVISTENTRGVTFMFTAPPNTFDDGTIIRELGLFLNLWRGTTFNSTITPGSQGMFSRLAQADGEFTPFVYIAGLPLTIMWSIIFTF
jgi:hypothetical protein